MSLKVYNGFKVNLHSLDEVADLSAELRTQAAGVARLVIAKEVLRRAVRYVDQTTLMSDKPYFSAISKLSDVVTNLEKAAQNCKLTLAVLERAIRDAGTEQPDELTTLSLMLDCINDVTSRLDIESSTTGIRSSPLRQAICSVSEDILEANRSRSKLPALDVEAELWVFREASEGGCRYFAMLHADNRDMYHALSDHPSLTPMPYWSSPDPPDNLHREEWSARSALWKQLLGDAGIPAQNCTTFSLCGYYGLSLFSENGTLSEPAILSYLGEIDISVEARADYWARRQWSNRRFRDLNEKMGTQVPFSQIFKIIDEAKDTDVSLEKSQIEAVLPKITADSLITRPCA